MSLWKPAAMALAVAAAYPGAALAQSNEELLKELRALKERVGQLEKKLTEQLAGKPAPVAAATAPVPAGMTAQETAEKLKPDVEASQKKVEQLRDAYKTAEKLLQDAREALDAYNRQFAKEHPKAKKGRPGV